MNKQEGIAAIEACYRQFEALFAGLSAVEMIEPGVVGNWSLKDLLVHFAIHEQRMLSWMRVRLQGEAPAGPQPYALPDALVDAINEQIFQENTGRSLAEAMELFAGAHQQVLDWLASAPEADLFDSQRFRLEEGEPLWTAIAANTCDHYAEHGADIQSWLKNREGRT